MRLYLVIDETRFYHPSFVADLIRKAREASDTVVGASLVTKILPKSSLEQYLKTNVFLLRPVEIVKLVLQRCTAAVREQVVRSSEQGPFFSVRAVYEYFGINYIDVEYNINRPEYLQHIRSARPDVILSSNSLIFGKELLGIPTICALNRHSALLPAYGGLWPVFQAYRSGETTTGVSVHTMERAIDRGVVLAQRAIPITETRTLAELYEECFACSADVVFEALEKVRRNDWTACTGAREGSYFGFPTREHWDAFRARGGRFI